MAQHNAGQDVWISMCVLYSYVYNRKIMFLRKISPQDSILKGIRICLHGEVSTEQTGIGTYSAPTIMY